jgi:hypothetical protein
MQSKCEARSMTARDYGMTSRQNVGRGRFDRSAGSHMRDAIHSRNSIPLPAGSISRIEPILERGHVSQALLDISALLYLLLFGVSVTLSVPLAIYLLIVSKFH